MSTISPSAFGARLAELRTQRNLSQAEVAQAVGLHYSDLSKIERGKRNPPKLPYFQRLREHLALSRKEALELMKLGGYSPDALGLSVFDPTDYPATTQEQARDHLQGDRGFWPVWELDTQGTILRANLLAFWLWGALSLSSEDTLEPERLLGVNVFSLYLRPENFARIAMPTQKTDFWYTKIMVFKKLEAVLPAEIVAEFQARILSHPILSLIYRCGDLELEEEWYYHLKIASFDTPKDDEVRLPLLEFEVSVERVEVERVQTGYLVTFQPLKSSLDIIDEAHRRLVELYGREALVQDKDARVMRQMEYPSFYPTLFLDPLWNLTETNRALETLLDGFPITQLHFFDLLLSGKLDDDVVYPRQIDQPPKALSYFLKRTAPYKKQGNSLYHRYEQLLNRLLATPGFRGLVKELWQEASLESLADIPKEGAVIYRCQRRCPYSSLFSLSFGLILYALQHPKHAYQVTFRPIDKTGDETRVALLLMELEPSIATAEAIGETPMAQLIWGLALIRTLQEGMTYGEGEDQWEAEGVFRRIYQSILAEHQDANEDTLEKLAVQIRLETLQSTLECSKPSREHILDMLLTFTAKAMELHRVLMTMYESAPPQGTSPFPSPRISPIVEW